MPTKLHMETHSKEKIGFLPDKQASISKPKNQHSNLVIKNSIEINFLHLI